MGLEHHLHHFKRRLGVDRLPVFILSHEREQPPI
jgi:hypothetical protein